MTPGWSCFHTEPQMLAVLVRKHVGGFPQMLAGLTCSCVSNKFANGVQAPLCSTYSAEMGARHLLGCLGNNSLQYISKSVMLIHVHGPASDTNA